VTTDNLTWVAARASGILGYLLVTASVSLGLLLSLKVRSASWPRFVTTEVHSRITLMALLFTALHGVMLWLDPFQAFTPGEIVVPFASHYRPLWVALGIIAGDVVLALYLSDYLRTKVNYDWWRRLHYATFVGWILVTLHGLGTGSDSRTAWSVALYAAGTLLVVGLIAIRLWPFDGVRRPAVMAIVAAGIWLGGVWAVFGPLQPGWNAVANNGNGSGQAGAAQGAGAEGPQVASVGREDDERVRPSQSPMPAQVTSPTAAAPLSTLRPATTSGPIPARFQATLAGTVSQAQQPDGSWQVHILGDLSGMVTGQLQLDGPQTATGALGTSQLRLVLNGVACDGTLRTGERGRLSASCITSAGQRLALQVQLQSAMDGLVTGIVATGRTDD
jgi:hypothetical protein